MKFITAVFLFLVVIPTACARLPHIEPPVAPVGSRTTCDCQGIYVKGDWQFVHAIEATPPGGQSHTMIGVSQISSARRTIHCVLMTLEGLVLFEADFNGGITIQRALAPLDAKGFAQGLIDDLVLIFLSPQGPLKNVGYSENGAFTCRYSNPDQTTQDILLFPGSLWEIRRYNADSCLMRTVTPILPDVDRRQGALPARMLLKSPGLLGYALTMTLVEALPMDPLAPNEKAIP